MASTFIALPVTAATVTGPVDVVITPNDSIKISDGTDTLAVNADGSINVVSTTGGAPMSPTYNELTGVASGVSTLLCSYTAAGPEKLVGILASGSNIAKYTVQLNGNTIAQKYTQFGGPLDTDFPFGGGLSLVATDLVEVYVLHLRPYIGDFNASILVQG